MESLGRFRRSSSSNEIEACLIKSGPATKGVNQGPITEFDSLAVGLHFYQYLEKNLVEFKLYLAVVHLRGLSKTSGTFSLT